MGEKGTLRVGREILEISEITKDGVVLTKPTLNPDFEIEPSKKPFDL